MAVFEMIAARFEVSEQWLDGESVRVGFQGLICVGQIREQIPGIIETGLAVGTLLSQDEIVFAESAFLSDLNLEILFGESELLG